MIRDIRERLIFMFVKGYGLNEMREFFGDTDNIQSRYELDKIQEWIDNDMEDFILTYVKKYGQTTVAEISVALNANFPKLKEGSLDAKIRKFLNTLVAQGALKKGIFANGIGRPYGSINTSWQHLYVLL